MAAVLFLLLIPLGVLLLALSDIDIEDGRVHAFVSFMLVAALIAPDAQAAVVICTAAVLEFEAALYVLRRATA
jgi:hypothetical protein